MYELSIEIDSFFVFTFFDSLSGKFIYKADVETKVEVNIKKINSKNTMSVIEDIEKEELYLLLFFIFIFYEFLKLFVKSQK